MADENAAATAENDDTANAGNNDADLDTVLKDAENPDAVKNAIARQKEEAKAARKRASDLEAKLKEYEDRDKTEQQKKDEAAAAAEKRATTAESKLLRFEVAAAKDIPLKHAHRLQGSTKEELEKDADELAQELGGQRTPEFNGGAREPANKADFDSLIRQRAGA